jgi:AcrR family transcriptional regulator
MYNYFRNKDEMFAAVLQPLMDEFEHIARENNSAEAISLDVFTSSRYQRDHIAVYMKLITRFRKELNLLLFHAHGSRYEDFRSVYTDTQTGVGMEYLRAMKRKYPRVNTDISPMFIHTTTSWWFSIIGELVSHNTGPKEMERFLQDYMAFGTAGWKKLMKV